jgi:hypothetical protein
MPMFHFNLAGRTAVADDDGVNLPSLVDAMEEAIGVAKDLGRNRRVSEVYGDQIVVTDRLGREVFRVPLIRKD